VEAYGQMTPINQLGTVNVPEPRMVTINVWDKSMVGKVEKAIRESGLGDQSAAERHDHHAADPRTERGTPPRSDRVAAQYAEHARVAIRNVRRDGMDQIKKAKAAGMSEDEQKLWSEEIQELTNKYIGKVDKALETSKRKSCRSEIGDRTRLDAKLSGLIDWIERETAGNDRVHLTVAMNYGGRNEITRATAAIARDVAAGKIGAEEISDALVSRYLDTGFLPDPDLVVRTSGETRVSNFLLWQAAYSEYVFTPVLWPDFTPQTMCTVLEAFAARERRFGGVMA
jgi:undecaprenyl diphosphate synthase